MKVYKIYETSYRYGDENAVKETFFTTPEVRDEYFKHLYKMSQENSSLHEEVELKKENRFVFEAGKWSYDTEKSDEELNIIESFEIDEKGRIEFKYKD